MDNQQGNLLNVMDKYFESMAYSIGALTGDGHTRNHIAIREGGKGFQIVYPVTISNMDRDCVGRVCWEINKLFDKGYDIVPYTNDNGTQMFRLAIGNCVINQFFTYFIREKQYIVDEVYRASKQAKLDYLAGLFDTDGYVAEVKQTQAKYGYSWRVGFASRHRTFIEDVTRLMQKMGVKVGSIYTQVSGHGTVIFVIKPNIRSFIETGCYFNIKRKNDRLNHYLDAMK